MNTKATNIKQRIKPNDVFITPLPLAKKQIDLISILPNEIWYDPFKNSGSYYNQFPTENKEWSEILDKRDFFEFNKPVDVICSNPPYSFIDKVLYKCIELQPRVISLLIGINNLTARRIEIMNEAGYGLKYLHMCKVFKWFGMSFIVHFEYGSDNCISYDRTVWR
tara:strand:+ start:156 stop:650 length:495 start_codon:yes stop_codon:yes gene_type:complete